MDLTDLVSKHIIIELKDGENVEGILVEVKDVDNVEDAIFYTTLTIRVDANHYRTIYINEIDTLGEIC